MAATSPPAYPVFVCYAHADNDSDDPDKRYLDRLLEQLGPPERRNMIHCWSDREIETSTT